MTGAYDDIVEASLAKKGPPLVGCVVDRPATVSAVLPSENVRNDDGMRAPNDIVLFGRRAFDSTDAGATRRGERVAPASTSPPYHNPLMSSRITVQLFRLDSDGTADPSQYTWTTTDFRAARDQVYGAFTLWVNEAAARNIPLSFMVNTSDPFSRYTRNFIPTPTRYEPITRSSQDDYLWVNDALARHGYGASPLTPENVYANNDAFNVAMAADPVYGPFDGSFSAYVVYNPAPAPETFANGMRAYALYDGPFTMLMWNSGWGPENLARISHAAEEKAAAPCY